MRLRPGYRQLSAVTAALLLLASFSTLAGAVAPGNQFFQRTWERTDKPVADDMVERTWMWGPEANTEFKLESYVESPGGLRVVQYFDKSRMEITHPDAFDDGLWYVTNGLLVVEMVTGQIQVGDATFLPHVQAEIGVAGDRDDVNGPTYATFSDLMGPVAERGSEVITETVNRAGDVGENPDYNGDGIVTAHWDDITQHNVAQPFWDFMTSTGTVYEGDAFVDAQLFLTPVYATGRPITEPYWAEVKVNGSILSVLMQCFERRCLTYTPDNSAGWQVEAGNVGQHYYEWRYGDESSDSDVNIVGGGGGVGVVSDGEIERPSELVAGQSVMLGAHIENTSDEAVLAEVVTTVECTNLALVTINQQLLSIPANSTVLYQTSWIPPDAEGTCTITITVLVDGMVVDTESWTVTISDDDGGSPTATATGTSTSTSTVTSTATSTGTVTSTATGTSTSTATSTATNTATSTSTVTPTNPDINFQQFGLVVGASIQVPGELAGGATVSIGARIQNNANVSELVHIKTTYDCPARAEVTINQRDMTIPANGSVLYQTNWTPPGLGLLCDVTITVTTERAPVDSDTEDWTVLLTIGVGGTATATATATSTATATATATATSTATASDPNINVQHFGVVVGANINILNEVEAGALLPLGARIQNFSNVAEEVTVTFDYRFRLPLGIVYGNWQSISGGTITIPANSSAVFQRNWLPSGLGTYQVRVTAETVRSPVDSDTESWVMVLVNP